MASLKLQLSTVFNVLTLSINSLAPGGCVGNFTVWFSGSLYRRIAWVLTVKLLSCECHKPHQWEVNIRWGDGLMPLGNKPLPEPTLTQVLSMLPYGIARPQWVNSMGPSDAIWQQKSGSTLAQVMACCLTAPSHYLNQCWLIISEVSDIHIRAISQEMPQPSITKICFKITCLKFYSNFPGANELNYINTYSMKSHSDVFEGFINDLVSIFSGNGLVPSGPKPLPESMMINICDPKYYRSWSTLIEVMACCLLAPSHSLNQYWLIIN